MTEKTPCFLYHEDFPKGKIFYDASSVNEALATGWMTGPISIKSKDDVVPAPAPVSNPAPVEEKPIIKPKKPRGKGKK